jgi:hypothetical protein
VVERLTDADLRALAQAAAQEESMGANLLIVILPRVLDRLMDAAVMDLAHATAKTEWATERTMHPLMEMLQTPDPTAQARAARLSGALIAAAADVLSADDLIVWAQHAPPTALARNEALAARRWRARAPAPPLRRCVRFWRSVSFRPTRRRFHCRPLFDDSREGERTDGGARRSAGIRRR